MLYAGIEIHKAVFQAVVLDPDSGELWDSRSSPRASGSVTRCPTHGRCERG
jgi:hypothetical protein